MPACFSARQVAHGVVWLACVASYACSQAPAGTAAIEFSRIPVAGAGGPARMETIAGTVRGARAGQRVVLYAKSGQWWVQPFSYAQFTSIGPDGRFESPTHLGTEYAAVLVDPSYAPRNVSARLPSAGNGVVAVATVPGRTAETSAPVPPEHLRFSGYDWELVGMVAGRRSGAWTDSDGRLHLRVDREGKDWTRAEVALRRSLGYGTYAFTIRDMPALEPATAFRMFTWDADEGGQNNREIDIELSQWGDPAIRNAQFVVQPYYVPANSFRFVAPAGTLQHSFRWEPGRVSFRTAKGAGGVAEHVFTSGIPTPGTETVHLTLSVYAKARTPQQKPVEVVIEKFEFLP